jgi:membrane-bound metal-dependent hydrolase YbcI (DUF457 family)
MPLPAAHAIVGVTLTAAWMPLPGFSQRVRLAGLCAVASILPDLDFALVWFGGLAREWHRGASHATLVGLAAGFLFGWASDRRLQTAFACAIATASHGFLDALTTVVGSGVELYWPFTAARKLYGPLLPIETDGALTLAKVMRQSALEIALFAPFALATWLVAENLRARRRGS